MKKQFDVVVVGAGVFGVWSAFSLQEAGLKTLLIDAWGVAHPRASSGGESRIIRTGYGPQTLYTAWAWEALARWKELEEAAETTLFVPCGVLWLARAADADLAASRRAIVDLGVPHRPLTGRQARRQFPRFELEGVEEALWEPACGALLARYACRQVARSFLAAGGGFRYGLALAPESAGERLESLRLASGDSIAAGRFVFCPGPWLGLLFPELLGGRFTCTRQEVFFWGTPAGSEAYFPASFPAWIDLAGDEIFYGLPALDGRGVKVACDSRGPAFDPSDGTRQPSGDEAAKVRGYLAKRLPELAKAPLVESRVCQYEQTSDSHLVIDRHPRHSNVWLAGGGSGHGFKLGPTVGRLVAQLVLEGDAEPPAEVRLARFR